MEPEPHLGCKPGDGVISTVFRPRLVHKVRFATASQVTTMCWATVSAGAGAYKVPDAPNCLDCLAR